MLSLWLLYWVSGYFALRGITCISVFSNSTFRTFNFLSPLKINIYHGCFNIGRIMLTLPRQVGIILNF